MRRGPPCRDQRWPQELWPVGAVMIDPSTPAGKLAAELAAMEKRGDDHAAIEARFLSATDGQPMWVRLAVIDEFRRLKNAAKS